MQALTALADPTRQRILEMLSTGALSAGDIASRFTMSAPAVSQHLKTLREAKLVRVRPEKQKRFYELDPEGVGDVANWIQDLRKFWANKLDALEAELNR
ncbi:MAG TPA: metalloregulator ArsR/SmtB family transcription factor [Rhizomicrobium sp.]|jgi:DNA-binding transcriptional ArsR family regulator|nr:metalloregulator ArsR/SmtB family transcription factor [Rhizomicrobium sp.]